MNLFIEFAIINLCLGGKVFAGGLASYLETGVAHKKKKKVNLDLKRKNSIPYLTFNIQIFANRFNGFPRISTYLICGMKWPQSDSGATDERREAPSS